MFGAIILDHRQELLFFFFFVKRQANVVTQSLASMVIYLIRTLKLIISYQIALQPLFIQKCNRHVTYIL
jgi:hypothetical protein